MVKIVSAFLMSCLCLPPVIHAESVFSHTRQPFKSSGVASSLPQKQKSNNRDKIKHPVDPDFGVRPPGKPHRPGRPGRPGKQEHPIYIVPPYYGGYYRQEPRPEPVERSVQPNSPPRQIIIVPAPPRTFKKCEEGPDSTDPDCMNKPKSSRQLRWEQFMRRNGG